MYNTGWQTYPCCPYPSYNDNSNQSWLWIVIIVFVIFFLIWGNDSNHGHNNGCC